MAQNKLWQPSDIVNADSDESDPPKRRGRIPQSAWPDILERHRAGATLTAIAREFDCTPSAISYIVRKAEAAGMATQASTPGQDAATAEGRSPADESKSDIVSAESLMTTESQATSNAETPAEEATPNPPAEAPAPATATAPAPAPARERRRPSTSGQASAAPPAQAPVERTRPKLSAGAQTRQAARAESREPEQPAVTTPEAPTLSGPAPDAQPTPAAEPPRTPQPRSEPIDAVEARLRDTARSCLVAYRGWRTQPGEASVQTLSDAMHELRKALARIEIDMSATRRDEQAQRPIPIPSHRASRRPR